MFKLYFVNDSKQKEKEKTNFSRQNEVRLKRDRFLACEETEKGDEKNRANERNQINP